MRTLISLTCLAMATSGSITNAQFVAYFDDSFAGGAVTGGGSGVTTAATTANANVSHYIRDTDFLGWAPGVGNPAPAINLFSGLDTGAETASFHLNLTTVAGATYQVALQTTEWGSNLGNHNYTVSVSAFDGADTTTGTALGTDGVVNGGYNTVKSLVFTFVAQSTSTTLFFAATIAESLNHDVWIDNIDIDEDLSTVPGAELRVVDCQLSPTGGSLTWTSGPGKTYMITGSLDLLGFPHVAATDIASQGTTTSHTFTAPAAMTGAAKAFYRVEEE